MTTINYFDNDITIFYNKDNHSCMVNKSIRRGRIWEKKLINIYKEYINKDSVVLDIGANLGCHTVPLSLLCKKVYAFEAQEKIYKLLSETIEYNKLDNVKLFNNIVSDGSKDELEFVNSGCGRGGTTTHRPRLTGNITTEKCITIDSLNLVKCDFIKIDVEGAEWETLAGATETIKKFHPVIILETWNSKKNMVKLGKYCIDYGYSFTYIKGDNYLLKPDNCGTLL